MASRALVLREGVAPVRDRLMTTLFVAALLHGLVILGLTFDTDADAGMPAPGLEVLLVSDEVPDAERNDTATYLAQRTQIGSGNSDEPLAPRNRASDLPVPARDGVPDGRTLAPQDISSGGDNESVLTASTSLVQVHYLTDLAGDGASRDKPLLLEERAAETPGPADETGPAKLRGPRREELWVTPDSRAASLAPYLDAWRRKVERIGTLNYPAVARNTDPRSSPVVEVAISADGQLETAVIRRSSGLPALDQAALDILRLASPFDPLPAELAREYRVLRFAYEWQFVGGRVEGGNVSTLP